MVIIQAYFYLSNVKYLLTVKESKENIKKIMIFRSDTISVKSLICRPRISNTTDIKVVFNIFDPYEPGPRTFIKDL